MSFRVCPELPTAPLASCRMEAAGGGAVDNSAPYAIRSDPTYKSGNAVQTNGATSEPNDFDDGVSVLLAESKLDGRPLGTMRLQTNVFRPLALESSVTLPDRFKGSVLAEAARLGVTQERVGRVVKTLLFKAFYIHCLNVGIDWMVITARSPLDKHYESLLFEDVFPERGYIPMSHVGGIPHRIFAHEIATAGERWADVAHPLYDLYFHTHHPDIDVGQQASLPTYLHELEDMRKDVLKRAALLS